MAAESSNNSGVVQIQDIQMDETKCLELQIPLLKNEDNLCWFDSGNFALFHKKRPELDTFFTEIKNDSKLQELNQKINEIIQKEEDKTIFTKDDFTLLENIYNHFNGTKIQNLRELIDSFRNNINFDNFLKESSEGAGVGFSISSGMFNDTADYISKLTKFNFFMTEKENKDSYIIGLSFNQIKIIDIILDYQFNFKSEQKPLRPSEKGLDNIFEKRMFTTDTYTLLIDTGKEPGNNSDINFLEKITIPLVNKTNSSIIEKGDFYLDSIVVHTGGAHYFVIVKCNNEWIYYNDTEIKENQTLEEFIKITELEPEPEPFNENKVRELIKLNTNLTNKQIEEQIVLTKQEYEKEQEKPKKKIQKIFTSFEEMCDSPVSNSNKIPNQGAKVLIYSREKI
jgi:hypothetical protein